MEIRNLRNLLQKLFKVPSSQQKLYVIINFQVRYYKVDDEINTIFSNFFLYFRTNNLN